MSGAFGDVICIGEALSELDKLREKAERNEDTTSIRHERTITRYLGRYAEVGPTGLGTSMYKPQTRISVGHNDTVFIYEFKSYQFRLYGAETSIGGRRTFLATACNPSKKKDKADPAILQKAAKVFQEYLNG